MTSEKNGSLRISMKWVGFAVALVSIGGAAIGAGNHVMQRLAGQDLILATHEERINQHVGLPFHKDSGLLHAKLGAMQGEHQEALKQIAATLLAIQQDQRALSLRIDRALSEKQQ